VIKLVQFLSCCLSNALDIILKDNIKDQIHQKNNIDMYSLTGI